MNNIKNLLAKYISQLKKISPTPQLDIEVVLSFILKKNKTFLYTHPEYKLNKKQISQFNKLINRRLKREPIAYIAGEKEFYGLNFIVNKNTLIPRPATETLVEAALKGFKIQDSRTRPELVEGFKILIDVGTGSGCIPIAIVKNLPKNVYQKTNIYAVDNSQKTLNIAKQNIKKHQLDKKIKLIKGDLLPAEGDTSTCRLRLASHIIITANLPYIPTSQYKNLSPDIKKYEPKQALVAGKDGLKYYRQLFKQIAKGAIPKTFGIAPYATTLIIEINPEQVAPIKKILKQNFKNFKTKIIKDLAGLNRVMIINLH